MALWLWPCVLLSTVLFLCDGEERVNLTRVIGSSITFPDPVMERGFLSFKRRTIASVSKGVFQIEEANYTNRLHWNSSGLFTLSHLQESDSGVYVIDSKKGNVFTKDYDLKVYAGGPELWEVKAGDSTTLPSPVSFLWGNFHILWILNHTQTLINPDKETWQHGVNNNRLRVNDTTGALLISNLSPADSGIYSAQIMNGDNRMHKVHYNLSVLKAALDPVLTPDSAARHHWTAGVCAFIFLFILIGLIFKVHYEKNEQDFA